MNIAIEHISDWFAQNYANLIITIVIILCYLFFRRLVFPVLERHVERDNLKDATLDSAVFSLNLLAIAMTIALIFFAWGYDFKGLLAFSTGLIAITGAALFASWSILSNITAFFILLAHRSYRRGNFLRIIDGDNYIEGYISEINLFSTTLISEHREIILYPNNLIIARPILVNPKERFEIMGKIQDFTGREAKQEQPDG